MMLPRSLDLEGHWRSRKPDSEDHFLPNSDFVSGFPEFQGKYSKNLFQVPRSAYLYLPALPPRYNKSGVWLFDL